MKAITVIVLVLLGISCVLAYTEEFEQWMKEHGKVYNNDAEKSHRFRVFLQNKRRITRLNEESRKNGGAEYGLNGFSDLTQDEFRNTYTNCYGITSRGANARAPVEDLPAAAPTKYDFRTQGAITPVKNQGQCGSCWAFSATEGVEVANWKAGNKLTVLSPQQIVSCDTKDLACNGGNIDAAWNYVESAGGLETEAAYPYTSGTTGARGNCNYDKTKVVQTVFTYAYATRSKNETQMVEASYAYGPLSIAVDAQTWSAYRSGIITSNCGQSLDHAVQIVGWDSSYSTPYWIVRNSWGSTWGESGYVRVEMFKDMCGIANDALYAQAHKV
jgi:C1A family cysteine protease